MKESEKSAQKQHIQKGNMIFIVSSVFKGDKTAQELTKKAIETVFWNNTRKRALEILLAARYNKGTKI